MIDNSDVSRVAVRVVEALEDAGLPCAVGGALALGLWGVPRGTFDVDLDVFVTEEQYEATLDALISAGCTFDRAVALAQARDQATVVVHHGSWRVAVFVPTIPFYADAQRRVQTAEFLGRPVPFLDAETIAVFKLPTPASRPGTESSPSIPGTIRSPSGATRKMNAKVDLFHVVLLSAT